MNRYLFVIDYQNDFVDGALGFPGAEKLAKRLDGHCTLNAISATAGANRSVPNLSRFIRIMAI